MTHVSNLLKRFRSCQKTRRRTHILQYIMHKKKNIHLKLLNFNSTNYALPGLPWGVFSYSADSEIPWLIATEISSPKSQRLATSLHAVSLQFISPDICSCQLRLPVVQRTTLSLTSSHTVFCTVSSKCSFRFHIDLRSLRTQRLRAHAISNNDVKREMRLIKRL
jgi:hypothetical protein